MIQSNVIPPYKPKSNPSFKMSREINADQPLDDIKAKVISYIDQPNRSKGKRTARVVIIGPRGSGKATLATRLASKYG